MNVKNKTIVISKIWDYVKAEVVFYCPQCKKEMRQAYIMEQLLVCDSCKEVYFFALKRMKGFDYKKIEQDNWGLKKNEEIKSE